MAYRKHYIFWKEETQEEAGECHFCHRPFKPDRGYKTACGQWVYRRKDTGERCRSSGTLIATTKTPEDATCKWCQRILARSKVAPGQSADEKRQQIVRHQEAIERLTKEVAKDQSEGSA